jgi:hypothetical protein
MVLRISLHLCRPSSAPCSAHLSTRMLRARSRDVVVGGRQHKLACPSGCLRVRCYVLQSAWVCPAIGHGVRRTDTMRRRSLARCVQRGRADGRAWVLSSRSCRRLMQSPSDSGTWNRIARAARGANESRGCRCRTAATAARLQGPGPLEGLEGARGVGGAAGVVAPAAPSRSPSARSPERRSAANPKATEAKGRKANRSIGRHTYSRGPDLSVGSR